MKRQAGQTLPLLVLFMMSILGFAAFAVDVGAWSWDKHEMQASADAAALAGVQGVSDGTYTTLGQHNFSLNGKPGESATYQLDTDFSANDSVLVTVTADKPTYIAALFGYKTVHVVTQARATAESITGENGVALPLAIFGANCVPPAEGTVIAIYGGNQKCGNSSSNAGTIQVPAAGQTAGPCGYAAVGNGNNDINALIQGTLASGTMLIGGCLDQTKTGNGPTPGNALANQTLPLVALVPVVKQTAGQGTNGPYTIIAFEWVQITGCSGGTGSSSCIGNNGKEIDGTVVGPYDGNSSQITLGGMIPGYVNNLGLTQ